MRLACKGGHGADLGGKLVVDASPVDLVRQHQPAGLTKDYTNADGIASSAGSTRDPTRPCPPSTTALPICGSGPDRLRAGMPSVDTVQPETTIGPVGRLLLATGKMPIAAELIDHQAATPEAPPAVAIDATYGKHIAQPCVGCHRLAFEGGPIAAGPPDWPPAPNLTQAGNLKDWSEEDFLKAMKTGVRPDGSNLIQWRPGPS